MRTSTPRRRLAIMLLGVLAVACSKASSFPQQEKTLLTVRVGGTDLRVELLRWGTHVPFGAGPGRGGFLDRAHDHVVMRGHVTSHESKFYAPLFELHWDTNTEADAVARWNRTWSEATAERCDAGDRVAFTIRGPGIANEKWIAVTVVDGRLAKESRDLEAPDCAAVRAHLAAASVPSSK